MASMFGFIKDMAKKAAQQVNAATATPAAIIPIGEKRVQMMEKLGEGGFAFVYKVEDVDTGQTYALKRMLAQDEENKTIAEKEINVMKKLQGHPNIIGFAGACKRDVPTEGSNRMRSIEYFILMEFCPGGSLIDLIQKRDKVKLPEKQLYQIFIQIVKAVHHMHSQTPPIAHRDLKLENVLIASDGVTLKLCDFGSTTTVARSYTTKEEICFEEEKISKYSTSMYRAPEMADLYKREVISEKVDVWALGCILYTLAFFVQPFQEGGNLQIISGNYDVPEVHPFSKYVTALIKRLLTVNPKKRPDTASVLELCSQWEKFLTSGKSATATSVTAATKKPKDTTQTVDTANNNTNTNTTATTRRSSQEKEHKTKHKHKQSATPQPVAVNPDFAADWNPFPDPSSTFSPPSASGSISSSSSHSHSHSHSNSNNAAFVTSPSPSPSPSSGFDPHFQFQSQSQTQSQSQSLAQFHAHHSSSGSNVAQLFDASAFEMPVTPSPHSLALSPTGSIPATSSPSAPAPAPVSGSVSGSGSAHPAVSPSRALGAPGVNPNWAAFTPPVSAPPVSQSTNINSNSDSDDVWSSFATDTSAAISAAASASHIHTAPPADEFSSFDWSGFSPPGKNESKDQGQGQGEEEDERRREDTKHYKQLVKKKKAVSREVSPSKPKSKIKSKRRASTSTNTDDGPPPASDNEDEQD